MKFIFTAILTVTFACLAIAQTGAEIIVTTAYLRKAPDLMAETIQTLKKGDKIKIENADRADGWILASNGKSKGWIRKEFVRAPEIVKTTIQTQPAPTPKPIAAAPTPKSNVNSKPIANSTPAVKPTPTPIPQAIETATAAPSTNLQTATTETPAAPTEENEVLRIETAEVNLTVRAFDQNNRPVKNLTPNDFRVYENGALQPITSVSTAEVPIINALVIDNSRSLRTQLAKVIEAGKIIVGTNRADDATTVVRFVSTDKIEVVQDFTANKNALDNALENLSIEGGQTAIIDAVYRTAQKVERYQNTGKQDDAKLRALVVVTDGDDRASTFKEPQLIELLRRSNVQIYAIGFVNNLSNEPDENGIARQEKAKSFLTRLTQETGGKVYFPNSLDELPKIATEIASELHTQYLISYAPTGENNNSSFRQIKVEINDGPNKEKRTAVARTGRSATPK